jgi:hypothetical protein
MKFLTTLLLTNLLISNALAAELQGNARVTIIESVAISQVTELDFGTISQLDGTCSMTSSGTLSGSDGQDCSGTSTPGFFQFAGASGQNISMAVTAGATVEGVTFTPKIDGSINRSLVDGATSVKIIGDLTLSNATLGDKNIAYTVTANYQ